MRRSRHGSRRPADGRSSGDPAAADAQAKVTRVLKNKTCCCDARATARWLLQPALRHCTSTSMLLPTDGLGRQGGFQICKGKPEQRTFVNTKQMVE